jgi:ribose transport system permease protein
MGKGIPFSAKDLLIKYNVFGMLIVLVIASTLLSPVFLTWGNITNVLRQLTPLMLVSLGMLLVILTGGIDLSVGSIAAVGGMVSAVALNAIKLPGYTGLILSILLALAAGLALGAVTGALVAFSRMAPFVASLAMMTMARGAAYMITNGEPLRLDMSRTSQQALSMFGSGKVPGILLPWPIVLGIVVIIIFALVVRFTTFGRLTIATGSNESAVRLAGITVEKYKFSVYAICGMLAAMGGMIITSRAAIGTPVMGSNLELDGIASCVIGGASLAGGKGGVVNTVIGVIVLGLIGNIMNLLSVPAYPQQIAKGAIIVIAVLTQGFTGRRQGA